MDMRQLEAFVAVATLGSFKAAANRLNLTQPAISARIAALEAEIGEDLFVRDVRPARLTDRAKRVLPHAQEILEISQQISPIGPVRESKGLERLRFGLNSSLVSGWLPGITDKLCQSLKNVALEFDVDISQHLIDKMKAGTLDICLMHTTTDTPGVKRHFVCELENVWAARLGVVREKFLSTEDLVRYKIFTFGPDAPSRVEFDAHLRGRNLWPSLYHVTNHSDVIINHIKWSNSVGLLIRDSIIRELDSGELEVIHTEFVPKQYSLWICHPLTKRNPTINICIEQILIFAASMLSDSKKTPGIKA